MKQILLIALLLIVVSCSHEKYRDVGDISFDERIDDVNFRLCDEGRIKQYYVRGSSDTPPGYKGEKRGLERDILKVYSFPLTEKENGYVTIRFIVNCEGKTGRFRVEEMDWSYKPRKFDDGITDQLLDVVSKLDDWIPRKSRGENVDFYQYLTFRIEKGQIVKILP